MRKSNHIQLRQILRSMPEGATVRYLCYRTGVERSALANSLHTMPDAYISGWELSSRGAWAAIWRVVMVPEHAAKPERPKPVAVMTRRPRPHVLHSIWSAPA